MKKMKRILSIFLILVMIAGVLPAAVFATDIPVAETGGTEYTTVQAAIDAAAVGDTVTLLRSVDLSNVYIAKALCLDLGEIVHTNLDKLDAGIADGYRSFQKFGGNYVGKIFVDVAKETPKATVTKLTNLNIHTIDNASWTFKPNEDMTLDFGYTFTAPYGAEDALESQYSPYHADFVVYADKDIPSDTIALAGQYDAFDLDWVVLSDAYQTGNKIRLLKDGLNRTMNYYEICNTVINFRCGAVDLSGTNALYGTTLTVELCLYPVEYHVWGTTTWNTEKTGAEPIVIGKYTYTWGETTVSYTGVTDGDRNGVLDTNDVIVPYRKTLTVAPNGGTWTVPGGFTTGNNGTYTLAMNSADPISVADPTNNNYKFTGWSMTQDNDGNVTLTATWEKNASTVTWVNDDGTVLETDPATVHGTTPSYDGATPTKPATNQYSYTFAGWSTAPGGDVVETLPAVSGDVTYYAVYTATYTGLDYDAYMALMMLLSQRFKITAAAGEGGTITPSGVSEVHYNSSITYTMIPMEGYKIASVTVDDVDMGPLPAYTFTRVKHNHTISVTYEKLPWQNPYSDVRESDWFYEDVKFVTEAGLMNGVGNAEFGPSLPLNRATVVTALWRLVGSPIVELKSDFRDLHEDWYTPAMKWAISEGIILGFGDGTCRPLAEITHEEAIAILHRFMILRGYKDPDGQKTDLPRPICSDWAQNDVLWALENHLFAGIGSDVSDLTKTANRAEIAAYLRRMCALMESST